MDVQFAFVEGETVFMVMLQFDAYLKKTSDNEIDEKYKIKLAEPKVSSSICGRYVA